MQSKKKPVDSDSFTVLNNLRKIQACENIYSYSQKVSTVQELLKHTPIENWMPLPEALDTATQEWQYYMVLDDIFEHLKNARPLKQKRAFFI